MTEYTDAEVAEAARIARELVGMAKAHALAHFRRRYSRDPIPMPAAALSGKRSLTRREKSLAVQADADARVYNELLTRRVSDLSYQWQESEAAVGPSIRSRLALVRPAAALAS